MRARLCAKQAGLAEPTGKSADWKIEVRERTANWPAQAPFQAVSNLRAGAQGMPASAPVTARSPTHKSVWLGRQDSNLGMAESKSAALPLGYAPTRREAILGLGGKRAGQ